MFPSNSLDEEESFCPSRGRAEQLRTFVILATIHKISIAKADLRGADLSDLFLEKCDFTGCDLRHVNFEGAFLAKAKLAGALIDGTTSFRGVKLNGGELEGIIVSGVAI